MLRPFLLIGVGGSGGKTLRVIREDLARRLQQSGWTGDLPRAWQFLHIDVPTVADGNESDLPAQLPERDYQGLVASGLDYRTIDSAMTSAGGGHMVDALGGWRPDPNRVNIPASKGAGQYRSLGRVITLASLDRIRDALQGARRQLTGAEVIGELQEVSKALGGSSSAQVPEPTVIVISSIAGGSGSGAVIDVCDAVRALGDKWANEIVGLLYAPDVFDYLPEEARRGVRPNSLAAISELLGGYWSEDGPSEGTVNLFAKFGVHFGAARRLGPRYPFLVGARNESVTYQTQNDIYRAMGRSLASWVTSATLQDRLAAYFQAQWPATAHAVRDLLPLHLDGTETPFAAIGSARVGLGRDRFKDYAAEHLARTVVQRYSRRHEELRQRGDDRTERQLVRDSADDVFGGFLVASNLDERGADRNQIIDALRPRQLKHDLRGEYNEILRKTKDWLPEKGARADDVRRTIRNLVNDRRSHFQTSQLAARADTGRNWVTSIQEHLVELSAQYIATNGAPVTIELLRRLSTEIKQVRDELVSEAAAQRRWAADVEQQIGGALNDADTAVILHTTDRLPEAVKRAVMTFEAEQEAEIRELAAELIPDLAANVLEPLIQAIEHATEAQAQDMGVGSDGRSSIVSLWPEGHAIPERLRPAPNEFLLEPADEYPTILQTLVQRTIGEEGPEESRRHADIQVLLGADGSEGEKQRLVQLQTRWTPRNHMLQSVTAAPTRASVAVRASSTDILARARTWLQRPGTAVGSYMAEGLRDYLGATAEGPAEVAHRLQRFEGQLIAALNAGSPLVKINSAVLMQVHERREVGYATFFSEIPLPDKSEARQQFRRLLEGRGQWNEGVAQAFSDNNRAFIDVFTVIAEPYEPVVFDSLMRPIASEWGARSKSVDQRAEFWRWRRARPLPEALPFSPSVLRSLVRGWFVAGCLDQLVANDEGVSIYVPAPIGKGGAQAAFPWPTLTAAKPGGPEILPALLESISLAMLDVNVSESLEPMRSYQRLKALGEASANDVPEELAAWILEGRNVQSTAVDQASWEVRRAAVETRVDGLLDRFHDHFEKVAARTDLLGFPGSYELRHEITAALGDLKRAVSSLQPVSHGGGFF